MVRVTPGVMIVLDGLGERPVPQLGGYTPLEAAHTPNLDALASRGMTGLMSPIAPGVPVSTVTGTAMLMGVPAACAVIPRGPIEAAGVGLKLEPGDIALRCNFATVRSGRNRLQLIDRRAGRIDSQTHELAEALTRELQEYAGVHSEVRAATEHRAVLLLRGEDLSAAITDVDPGDGREELGMSTCRALDSSDSAASRTAEVVNRIVARSHLILRDNPVNGERAQRGLLPANLLLPRQAGQLCNLPSVVQHLGMRGAVVSGEATLFGLARLLDMTSITERGFTGNPSTDLEGKVRAALRALDHHDLVYLHVKATDTLGHDGNFEGKVTFLQAIDKAFARLLGRQDLVMSVAADHSTPCVVGRHTGDPVPVMLCSPNGRRDHVRRFGETDCTQGGMGHLSANSLLWSMVDQMGFTHNIGMADLPLFSGRTLSSQRWDRRKTTPDDDEDNVVTLR